MIFFFDADPIPFVPETKPAECGQGGPVALKAAPPATILVGVQYRHPGRVPIHEAKDLKEENYVDLDASMQLNNPIDNDEGQAMSRESPPTP